jgi:hypothetical protein
MFLEGSVSILKQAFSELTIFKSLTPCRTDAFTVSVVSPIVKIISMTLPKLNPRRKIKFLYNFVLDDGIGF